MSSARGRANRWIRTAHRWLGLALLLWLLAGTLRALPGVMEADGTSGLEAVAGVFALEAEGGGPVNEPWTLTLITLVAAVGTFLFIERLRKVRGFIAPRTADGWLRLVHRWIGAAFTVSLIVYLVAMLAGGAPAALGWTWLLLLFTVNIIGLVMLEVHVIRLLRAAAIQRRRERDATAAT